MTTAASPLEIRPVCGEAYTYFVTSATHPQIQYRVDILANGGAGNCTCFDFATRRMPAIKRGEPMLTSATRCKHLKATHDYFLREILTELARQQKEEA